MQPALSPSPATPAPEWPEPFYRRDGHVFRPTPSAVSPWNPKATNGVALAGLVGMLLEKARGEWMVVDADTDSAGNGVALTTSAFYDMGGLFARGHQTLFMEPRKG